MATSLENVNQDPTSQVHGIEGLTMAEARLGSLQYQNNLKVSDIRVLHIVPSSGPYLECKLEHVALSQPPDYIAISYAWGDVDDKVTIIVDGYKLDITRSLYGALNVLRHENKLKRVTVWADAICVNQQNKQELSAQVSIMANIYRNARYTAAFLGPEREKDHLAIELLQHLVKVKDSEPDFRESILSRDWYEHFFALASLFNRDYWRRMWILQEVHNGTSVRIYCGTRWLPWETYRDVSRAFRRSDLDLRGIFMRDVLEETQEFIWYILCYEGPNALDLEEKDELLDYLAWCQSKRCTDPKDKLYALLGVLPEAIKNHFQPDYSVSVKRVYTDIVEYILGSTRRLDILCHATKLGTHLHNNKYFLPSWIPDWSYQLQVDLVTEICGKYAASSETAQFAISGGLSRGLTSGSHTRLRPQRLEIKAVFVGTIARVGLHIPEIHFIDDILMAFLNWRALIKQLGRVDENEVLCRTMTMDMVEDWNLGQLTEICFHMFAQRLQSDLPHIPLDDELKACSKAQLGISDDALDAFWAKYIERTYENRRLFISEEGGVGLSPPNIDVEDVICVPLGCSTPVILRPWNRGEYKFVCDAYIDGYMYGQADTEWKTGTKDLQTYILV